MHVTSTIHDGASAPAREPSLAERYSEVRQTSMRLCSPLSIEDHCLQSMPDTSPAKWHLAHTTWFFETFLLTPSLPGYKPVHPAFRNFFNSYYEAVGDRPLRALRHTLSRPSLAEVHSYRSAVDDAMAELLRSDPAPEVLDLVQLGINHEQQHQELHRHRRKARAVDQPAPAAISRADSQDETRCAVEWSELAEVRWRFVSRRL